MKIEMAMLRKIMLMVMQTITGKNYFQGHDRMMNVGWIHHDHDPDRHHNLQARRNMITATTPSLAANCD